MKIEKVVEEFLKLLSQEKVEQAEELHDGNTPVKLSNFLNLCTSIVGSWLQDEIPRGSSTRRRRK